MSNVSKINVSTLKEFRKEFSNEKKHFINKSYNTFSSSYINNCQDPSVIRMRNGLDKMYRQIEKGYNNIDKWWKSYNTNITGLENFLSNSGKSGSISESSIRSYANSKLSTLSNYKTKIGGNVSSKVIGLVDSITFVNNGVVSTIDGFSRRDYTYDAASVNFNDIVNNNNISNQVAEATLVGSGDMTENIDLLYNDVLGYSYEVGSVVSNETASAWEGLAGWWDDVKAWWKDDAWPWIKQAASTVWDVLKSVGATIAVFVQSLVEGVLQLVEAIIDFVALVGTAVASIVTGLIDGGQAIYGAITGEEWSSVTKKMWGGTMGFVSTQYVQGWFDLLYDNTGYGQW